MAPPFPPGGTLGLDEAGRGCVLGPLAMGAFLLPPGTDPDRLLQLGVKDSKRLTPSRREELVPELERLGTCRVHFAPPALIDRFVAKGRYNDLELDMMARLVVQLDPSEAFADACDANAPRFESRLRARARHGGWGGRLVARHKADRDLPVVAAASIVAKVARDRELAKLQATSVKRFGSGYPSDPLTREFLRRLGAPASTYPSFVRRSWSTLDKLKSRPPVRRLESYR